MCLEPSNGIPGPPPARMSPMLVRHHPVSLLCRLPLGPQANCSKGEAPRPVAPSCPAIQGTPRHRHARLRWRETARPLRGENPDRRQRCRHKTRAGVDFPDPVRVRCTGLRQPARGPYHHPLVRRTRSRVWKRIRFPRSRRSCSGRQYKGTCGIRPGSTTHRLPDAPCRRQGVKASQGRQGRARRADRWLHRRDRRPMGRFASPARPHPNFCRACRAPRVAASPARASGCRGNRASSAHDCRSDM